MILSPEKKIHKCISGTLREGGKRGGGGGGLLVSIEDKCYF